MLPDTLLLKIIDFYRESQISSKTNFMIKNELVDEIRNNHKLFEEECNDESIRGLVFYNSNHFGEVGLFKKVITNLIELKNGVSPNLEFIDCSEKNIFGYSELRHLGVMSIVRFLINPQFKLFDGKWLILLKALKYTLQRKSINHLFFFTANSRIVELFRINALDNKIRTTEFLHGISLGPWIDYLDILDLIDNNSGLLEYINLYPGLVQPDSIKKNLLLINEKEVFFENSKRWKNSTHKAYDVCVVGGNFVTNNYFESKYFKAELNCLGDCLKSNLKVCYAPHQANRDGIEEYIPQGVIIGSVDDDINSSKIIVGNFSTVLFMAYIKSMNVYLFEEGIEFLTEDIKNTYPELLDRIFSIDTFFGFFEQQSDTEIRNIKEGINLEKLS